MSSLTNHPSSIAQSRLLELFETTRVPEPFGSTHSLNWKHLNQFAAAIEAEVRAEVPVDMVLFCPACGLQHVDEPAERELRMRNVSQVQRENSCDIQVQYVETPEWSNPPHRSHLCHGCGHIWRPADVPTNGVKAVLTKGKKDSPIVQATQGAEPMAWGFLFNDKRGLGVNTYDTEAQAGDEWTAEIEAELGRLVPLYTHPAPASASEPGQPEWLHLKQYGYAPGNYLAKCHSCGKVAEFIDKRAITCRPCAEAKHAAASASVAGAGETRAEHEAFENWVRKTWKGGSYIGSALVRGEDGEYGMEWSRKMWRGWSARADLPDPDVKPALSIDELEAALVALADKPLGYRFDLRGEGQLLQTKYGRKDEPYPFGRPGHDFSAEYEVESTPLYPPRKP